MKEYLLENLDCADCAIKIEDGLKKLYEESSIKKIMYLVGGALVKKAKTEKLITKFSHYYTPIVVLIAFIVAVVPPFILGLGIFYEWLYRSLVMLVIS